MHVVSLMQCSILSVDRVLTRHVKATYLTVSQEGQRLS